MVINSRICSVVCALVSGVFGALSFGAPEPETPDPKINETANAVQQIVGEILPEVDTCTRPATAVIANGQKALDEGKRYFIKMDDKQKAQYCLLQSWVSYYSGSQEMAFMNAAKACKLDAESGDAWATQAVMAILDGKRPMVPRAPRTTQTRGGRNRANGEGAETQQSVQVQKGRLDFDITSLVTGAIGQKIEAFELRCVDDKTMSYTPGNEGVCILFWRNFDSATPTATPAAAPAARTEPNDTPTPAAQAAPMNEGDRLDFESLREKTAFGAFNKLYQTGGASKQMKFMMVNLDANEHRQFLSDRIAKLNRPWGQAIITEQVGGALSNYATMPITNEDKAILMMADTTGTIRYAGSAKGFIATMLMEQLAPGGSIIIPIEEAQMVMPNLVTAIQKPVVMDSNTPTKIDANSLPSPVDSNSLAAPKKKKTVTDSNSVTPMKKQVTTPKPAAPAKTETAAPQTTAPQTAAPENQYRQLSEEDQIQAEKIITYAEDLFMKAAGKHVMTYKRGVELCRQVMKEYPETEYADRARKLLRQVPENQRERFGITNDELGL